MSSIYFLLVKYVDTKTALRNRRMPFSGAKLCRPRYFFRIEGTVDKLRQDGYFVSYDRMGHRPNLTRLHGHLGSAEILGWRSASNGWFETQAPPREMLPVFLLVRRKGRRFYRIDIRDHSNRAIRPAEDSHLLRGSE